MKKLNLLIALFFIATLSFNVYLNLNNPFQFSSEQVIAQETGKEKTTSCPDHNYVADRYLSIKLGYEQGISGSAKLESSVSLGGILGGAIGRTLKKFFDPTLKSKAEMDYKYDGKYVQALRHCDNEKEGECCDQRKVGLVLVERAGTQK